MENFGIPGLTYAGQGSIEPPIILVIGPEKVGKSTLALSLYDWPHQGCRPVVLAFDALGFDSVAQWTANIGPCPGIKVKDMPGLSFWDKTNCALTNLENAFRSGRQTPLSSILVDCGSTMVDKLMQEGRAQGGRDPRQAFGYALNKANEVLWRLSELGKPVIWLAWLKEGFMDVQGSGPQKRQKMVLGGAQIEGSFRAKLTGKATQVMILEKVKHGNVPGADSEGYIRQFHTRTYNNVEAGGRLSQFLPEPCPANLGYVLSQITQGRQIAPVEAQIQQQVYQQQGTQQPPPVQMVVNQS